MTTKIPHYKTKSVRKSAELLPTKKVEDAMNRLAKVSQESGAKQEKTQREARAAIAETINALLDWLQEENSEQVHELFLQLMMLATPGNRSKIAKHIMIPDGVIAQAEEIISKAKQEEAEAKQKAEAAKAAETEAMTLSKPSKSNEAPRLG